MSDAELRKAIEDLKLCLNGPRQNAEVERILAIADDPDAALQEVIESNPFLCSKKALRGRAGSLAAKAGGDAASLLLDLRQACMAIDGHRIGVFCAPKSGSSFTAFALEHATGYRLCSLTTYVPVLYSSKFGMNGREQEIDEFALLYQILKGGGNLLAQHHTRCTPYLCNQLNVFRISPVVTYRNVFDSIISFDEMAVPGRHLGQPSWRWGLDWSARLPENYHEFAFEERMELLAPTLGIWIVEFYLSWKRCEAIGLIRPLWLRYESDILDKASFVDKVGRLLRDPASLDRLAAYCENPDPGAARLNQGVAGRGKRIPEATRNIVANHARKFASELTAREIGDLLDWER